MAGNPRIFEQKVLRGFFSRGTSEGRVAELQCCGEEDLKYGLGSFAEDKIPYPAHGLTRHLITEDAEKPLAKGYEQGQRPKS
jgi:hypothetical protein